MNVRPPVSIVIAMFNEQDYIVECLDSIFAQDFPAELLEIIVVDGASTDRSKNIVQSFFEKKQNIFLLDNPKRVAASSFNAGIKKATGEIVVILSAHCRISDNYISECVSLLSSANFACVGGPVEHRGKTKAANAIAHAMSSPFGVGDARFRYSHKAQYVDTIAFGAYRRNVFESIGLFNESLQNNIDAEFNARLVKAGQKLFLSPAIRSSYYVRNSFRLVCKQYFRYGNGKIRAALQFPGMLRLRHFVPAFFTAAIIILLLVSLTMPVFVFLLLGILGVYGLFLLAGAAVIWHKKGPKSIHLVPVALVCLHVSYGIGFWAGIIRSIFRGNKRG